MKSTQEIKEALCRLLFSIKPLERGIKLQEFFSSRKFKIFIGIIILLICYMLYTASTEDGNTLLSYSLYTITTPLQKVSTATSQNVGGFFEKHLNIDKYIEENEQLKEENAALKQQLIDYEELKAQVEGLQNIVGTKESNQDFDLEQAAVIARDPDDIFASFTIDKGANNGIEKDDPVITGAGLVGKVLSVTPGNARIITIMNPGLYVSAYDANVNQVGSVQGDAALAEDNSFLKFIDLPLRSEVAEGDLIVTGGSGGIFPKKLSIGTVVEVNEESNGKSSYAVIKPEVDFENLTQVFIIKSFDGQGTVQSSASGEE